MRSARIASYMRRASDAGQRATRKRSVPVGGFIVLGALTSVVSLAVPTAAAQASPKGSGSSHTTPTSPLSLTSETVDWNPSLPGVTCLTEDDYDARVFSGSLNGSFSTTYQLCDLNADGYTAGGIGLQSDVSVVGQLSDLTITAPDGTVHHAVLMTQTTSRRSTTSTYAVCYVPVYYTSTNTSTDPLTGGAWQITLSGQIGSVSWQTNALMANVSFQENSCPSSEQNLSP